MTDPITIYRSTHSSHDDPTWHITYRHPELNDPMLVRFIKMGRDRCLLRSCARWDGEKWDPDRWVPTQPVVPRWLIRMVEQAMREGVQPCR